MEASWNGGKQDQKTYISQTTLRIEATWLEEGGLGGQYSYVRNFSDSSCLLSAPETSVVRTVDLAALMDLSQNFMFHLGVGHRTKFTMPAMPPNN